MTRPRSSVTPIEENSVIKNGLVFQVGKEFRYSQFGKLHAVFQCACGEKFIEWVDKVKFDGVNSCAAYHYKRRTDGSLEEHLNHPLFKTWSGMLERCYNRHHNSYKNYGGRGITVCERWLKFDEFSTDMGERPSGTTLDRIDNDEGYSPNNCKWSTKSWQARNRRSNRLITINDVTKTLVEWSEQDGAVSISTIRGRLNLGWPFEKAIFHPSRNKKRGGV